MAAKGPDNSAASRFEVGKAQVVRRSGNILLERNLMGQPQVWKANSEENLEKDLFFHRWESEYTSIHQQLQTNTTTNNVISEYKDIRLFEKDIR